MILKEITENKNKKLRLGALLTEMRGDMTEAEFKKHLMKLTGMSWGAVQKWVGVGGIPNLQNPSNANPLLCEVLARFKRCSSKQIKDYIEYGNKIPNERFTELTVFEIKNAIAKLPLKDLVFLSRITNDRICFLAEAKRKVSNNEGNTPPRRVKKDLCDRELFNLKKLITATIDHRGWRQPDGQADYFTAAMSTGEGTAILAKAIRELEIGSAVPVKLSPATKTGLAKFCCRIERWDQDTPIVASGTYEGDWEALKSDLLCPSLDNREDASRPASSASCWQV